MAKKLNLKDTIYQTITDAVSSSKIGLEELAEMGFSDNEYDFKEGHPYDRDTSMQALVNAYNNGLKIGDFGEFLRIIAHKEDIMDRRSDTDFQKVYASFLDEKASKRNDGNGFGSYNEKIKGISSIKGKLAKQLQKDSVPPVDFWQLLSAANYSQNLMEKADPYLKTLQYAQLELLNSNSGLKSAGLKPSERSELSIDPERREFLEKLGVLVSHDSASPFVRVSRGEYSLEDVISGKMAEDSLKADILNGSDGKDDTATIDQLTFFKRKNKINNGLLTNSAMRAQMLAGKQTYSVLVAPIVKKALGFPEFKNLEDGFQVRKFSDNDKEMFADILGLKEGETVSSVVSRVNGYADFIYTLTHPSEELRADMQELVETDLGPVKMGELNQIQFENWIYAKFVQPGNTKTKDEVVKNGLGNIIYRLNEACIANGTYAEGTAEEFCKSMLVSTSSESLGLQPDFYSIIGQNKDGSPVYGQETGPLSASQIASGKYYIPVTVVTEFGAYETKVNYATEGLDKDKDKLLDKAIGQLKNEHKEANLRHLTTDNLIVGTNPLMRKVMDEYNEVKSNSELKISKNNAELGGKRNKKESTPLLFRDLQLYQQFKQQAQQTIKAFVFRPIRIPQLGNKTVEEVTGIPTPKLVSQNIKPNTPAISKEPPESAPSPTEGGPKPPEEGPNPTGGSPKPPESGPSPTEGGPKPPEEGPNPTSGSPKPTGRAPKLTVESPGPKDYEPTRNSDFGEYNFSTYNPIDADSCTTEDKDRRIQSILDRLDNQEYSSDEGNYIIDNFVMQDNASNSQMALSEFEGADVIKPEMVQNNGVPANVQPNVITDDFEQGM